MGKVLQRRKSIESVDDEIVELPVSSSAVDDSWRYDFESDDEARESTSAPANRKGRAESRISMAAANMSLKSRVAALAKITQ